MKRTLTTLALVSAAVLAPMAASATDSHDETWWLVPAGVELEATDHPQSDGYRVDSDGFPQTLIGGAADIPCGRYAQVDQYPIEAAERITADGTLTEGEDHADIESWRFVTGACDVTELAETGSDHVWVIAVVGGTIAGLGAGLALGMKRRKGES